MRAVDWDAAQLAALADDAAAGRLKPGERRTVRGRIRQTDFPCRSPSNAPIRPCSHGITTVNNSSCSLPPTIPTATASIQTAAARTCRCAWRRPSPILSDAAGGRDREIDLLTRGDRNSEGRAMTGCFWAPELHVISGKLSCCSAG